MLILMLVTVVHFVSSLLTIILILICPGKGNIGSSFGLCSSHTVFGSRGSAPFITKLIYLLAAIFFITSISLNYLQKQRLVTVKENWDTYTLDYDSSQVDYQKKRLKDQGMML